MDFLWPLVSSCQWVAPKGKVLRFECEMASIGSSVWMPGSHAVALLGEVMNLKKVEP